MHDQGSTTGGATRRRLLVVLATAALVLVGIGCGSSTTSGATAGSTAPATSAGAPGTTVAVQKDVLATDPQPPGAPGRTLTLIRYTIAPGAKLAPHVHPGVQLASIQSGTLTYTVVSGTVTLTRASRDAGESAGPTQVTGPTTITLGPGDVVAETGDMVHYGANETSSPVVILASLLTETGKDLAVTVTTTAP